MDPIDLLRTVRGRWAIIAVTCIVGIVGGWVTTPGGADERPAGSRLVTASHVLLVEPGDQRSQAGAQTGEQDLETAALLATIGEVPQQAAAELGADAATLLDSLSVTAEPTRRTITISATDDDPARAVAVANTFAAKLLDRLSRDAEERHAAELAEAQRIRSALEAELAELPASAARQQEALVQRVDAASQEVATLESQGPPGPGFTTVADATVEGVVPARAPAGANARGDSTRRNDASESGGAVAEPRPEEDPPNRAVRMLIGGMVGLVLGIGLALLRERLDTRVRTKEAAEAAFGLPVLAEIPVQTRQQRRQLEVATTANGRAVEAEAYRVLRTSLLFAADPLVPDAGANGTAGAGPDTQPRVRHGSGGGTGSTAIASIGPLDSVDDLRRAARGLPILGVIPALGTWTDPSQPRLASKSDPTSPAAAAYRSLRSPLQHVGLTGWLRTLRITSASSGEGKTATVANLGLVLARAGHRVTLVDCDLRQPRLHEYFGLPNSVGLASMVSGEVGVSATCQSVSGEERLTIVTSGPLPPDPARLLASPRTAEVLGALAVQSDIVILDTPAVNGDDDAALAALVDATVVMASKGTTSANRLQHALELLARSGTPLAGVVFNRADAEPPTPDAGGAPVAPVAINPPTGPLQEGDGSDGSPETPSRAGRDLDVVLVTSPGAEEGKTSTALNLAATLGETDTSVLVLDLDLRRPSIHRVLDLPNAPGVTDALDGGPGAPSLAEIARPTSLSNVVVAPSGTEVTDPAGLLPGGRDLLARARSAADVVIVDTPPLLAASDAGQLIPAADAVVVVCRAGRTSVHAATRCAEQLARLGAPTLGVVLTAAPDDAAYGSYYYGDTLLRSRGWHLGRRSRPRRRSTTGEVTGPSPAPTTPPGSSETAPPAPAATGGNGKAPAKTGSSKASRAKKMAKPRS